MKVSALLLTYNEERNIGRCLDSLGWCDDIIVVDSGSTDATIAIAERAGARVLARPFDNFANQRNFGLEHGAPRHEWVLHLDADEAATPEFTRKITALEPAPGIDAYRVPSKTMLGEHWLKHAGMYPTYQVRLGHRERLRFVQVGHGQREDLPAERVATFDEPYLHFNFSHGIPAWLRKHIKYAEDEAKLLLQVRDGSHVPTGRLLGGSTTDRRRRAKEAAARLPLMVRPFARFFYVLVIRRGILDGRLGLLYATMLAVYEAMIAIIVMEGRLLAGKGSAAKPGVEQLDKEIVREQR